MKRTKGFLVLLVLLFSLNLFGANLKVHVLNVGQGDSYLIVSPTGKTVLIDAGNNGKGNSVVLPYLNKLGITDLNYIIASHLHADHIGGIDDVIKGIGGSSNVLGFVFDRGGSYSSNTYNDYVAAAGNKRVQLLSGDVIDLGNGASFSCIAVDGKTTGGTHYTGSDENQKSIVILLDYQDFQMVFGGDIGESMEPHIATYIGNVDIYKVHHHGSKTASTAAFLSVIQPEVSTISVGKNSYDHPTLEVLNRLKAANSYVYQTEAGNRIPDAGFGINANGNFVIETDGESYSVTIESNGSMNTWYTDGSHYVHESISITSPNSGENYSVGSTQNITWTSSGSVGNVKIEYSTNNGSSWSTITSSTSNDGSFSWTVPNTPSTQCKVKVMETDGSPSDTSDSVFSIVSNLGETNPPFGSFDTPVGGSTVSSSIAVTGWALDDSGISSVKIYRNDGTNQIYIGDAIMVEGARPDIESAYPGYPGNTKAGWGYMMLTNFLPNNGNGTFILTAIATDGVGKSTTLGTKTITCDNANAVKPFGAIDLPGPGETVSGNNYLSQGWVLTPQPNSIPTDGSTLSVIIDGVNVGHPAYNLYRPDIAGLFPTYANSNGSMGRFYLDTTAYSNGTHTIQWSATDNAGNSDGIGSRYFSINNSSSDKFAATANSQKITLKDLEEYDINYEPVKLTKGFNSDVDSQIIIHDFQRESQEIAIRELERVVLELNTDNTNYIGYLKLGGRLRKLPIGSTIKDGKFYWSPGPGFIGEYDFVFVDQVIRTIKNIKIRINPKFGWIDKK